MNNLSPAEVERLALLIEEFSEVIQIACKILRHGYESTHPNGGPNNRKLLTKELGDASMAMDFMAARGDVFGMEVAEAEQDKYDRVRQYLHHNTIPEREGPFE